jgi:hypothetical protein
VYTAPFFAYRKTVDTQPDYASFLIRLWREPHASRDAGWLAQAEFIPSGEQRYFTSLDELFDFIRAPLLDPRWQLPNDTAKR